MNSAKVLSVERLNNDERIQHITSHLETLSQNLIALQQHMVEHEKLDQQRTDAHVTAIKDISRSFDERMGQTSRIQEDQLVLLRELKQVIHDSVKDMATALSGKDQVSTAVMQAVVKILGTIVVSLLAVIVFLIAGTKLNILPIGG